MSGLYSIYRRFCQLGRQKVYGKLLDCHTMEQGGVDLSVVGPSLVDCKRVFYRPKSRSLLDGSGTQWILCVASSKDDVGLDYPYILAIGRILTSSFVNLQAESHVVKSDARIVCMFENFCMCV